MIDIGIFSVILIVKVVTNHGRDEVPREEKTIKKKTFATKQNKSKLMPKTTTFDSQLEGYDSDEGV